MMLTKKDLPFTSKKLQEISEKYGTPFHVYDEKSIRTNFRRLVKAFAWAPEFKEYYAVKACPNPVLLKILKEEGSGMDCSSMAELILAERVGIRGNEIMFTSNNTPIEEYQKAIEMGAVLNLDDIGHIDFISKEMALPSLVSFRYNPGPARTGNVLIGNPVEAKYGVTKEQLFEGYLKLKEQGVQRYGLHTMIASNELEISYFFETARMLFDLVAEIKEQTGCEIEMVNFGGGIGIPYRPGEEAINLEELGQGIHQLYQEKIVDKGLHPLKLSLECGRMITGPYGALVTKVIHDKETYKHYIGVDACMANLMRPGVYGAYHHISVLGKENQEATEIYDVVGSLCENCDKFAIDRKLPLLEIGDLLAIHDTGAHGYSMGFQYNGKLRSPEFLLKEDGTVKLIRRGETLDDYFATLDFDLV